MILPRVLQIRAQRKGCWPRRIWPQLIKGCANKLPAMESQRSLRCGGKWLNGFCLVKRTVVKTTPERNRRKPPQQLITPEDV